MPESPATVKSHDAEERLVTIFTLVNDWLKYAEAKNGGILALAAGAIALTLPQLRDTTGLSTAARIIFGLAEVALFASALASLVSFLPQTDLTTRLAGRPSSPTSDDNLFFFGHLAKYKPATLAAAFQQRYGPGDASGAEPSAVERDLAAQIVVNARITLWKLRLFTIAVVFLVVAVLLFAIGGLVALA